MIDMIYNLRVGDIHAAEMRAAYKVGFKDGVTLMREIQEQSYIYLLRNCLIPDSGIRLFLFKRLAFSCHYCYHVI